MLATLARVHEQLLVQTLFGVCEGLWAVVMDTMSPLPFEATWTSHASFAEYGAACARAAAAAVL